jgi:hypothetical protein
MRALLTALILAATASAAAAQTPIEIDRTLQRVNGAAIMTSDVRQARILRLLTPPPASDDAVLTALENRLLMLSEAARSGIGEPAAAQIAARRQAWAALWPSPAELAAQIHRSGMTDRGLDGWFRDDLRIDLYIEQRFPPDPKRDERLATWIKDLRQRANLPNK